MSWEPVDVLPASALTYRADRLWIEEGEHFGHILRISFAGVFGVGSAGNPDGRLMAAVLAATLANESPDVVVLDLRELDYQWGDGMITPMVAFGRMDDDPPMSLLLVGGPRSYDALHSLTAGAKGNLFDDLDAALVRARALLIERCILIG